MALSAHLRRRRTWLSVIVCSVALVWLPAQSPFDGTPTPTPGDPFANESPTATPAAPDENPFEAPAGTPISTGNPFEEPAPTAPVGEVNPFDAAPPAPNPFDAPGATGAPAPTAPPPPSGGAPANPFTEPDINPFDAPARPVEGAVRRSTVIQRAGDIRGLMVLSDTRGFQNAADVRQMMQDFREAQFNRLYIEVRTASGVAYQSEIDRKLPSVTEAFASPAAEVRRQLPTGAEMIAVVNLLPAYNAVLGSRIPRDHFLGERPELMDRTVDDRHISPDNYVGLDPGSPAARAHLARVMAEVMDQVKPDGVLLKAYSYPGPTWGYSPGAIAAFRAAVGGEGPPPPDDPTWTAWRRAQVTQLVTDLRRVVIERNPNAAFGVYIPADQPPPMTWDAYTANHLYADRLTDWLSWYKAGTIDEIVVAVHERVSPQENTVVPWVQFLNQNSSRTMPVISLAGRMNYVEGFRRQYMEVRGQGVGTLLHHYAEPVRSVSRGFFSSLPSIVFRTPPGNPVPGEGIRIPAAASAVSFAPMTSPPASVARATPSPTVANPLDNRPLVFSTPAPSPSPTPALRYVPDSIQRNITMRSGQIVEAVVLEVTPEHVRLQPKSGTAVNVARSMISKIEPPL